MLDICSLKSWNLPVRGFQEAPSVSPHTSEMNCLRPDLQWAATVTEALLCWYNPSSSTESSSLLWMHYKTLDMVKLILCFRSHVFGLVYDTEMHSEWCAFWKSIIWTHAEAWHVNVNTIFTLLLTFGRDLVEQVEISPRVLHEREEKTINQAFNEHVVLNAAFKSCLQDCIYELKHMNAIMA